MFKGVLRVVFWSRGLDRVRYTCLHRETELIKRPCQKNSKYSAGDRSWLPVVGCWLHLHNERFGKI